MCRQHKQASPFSDTEYVESLGQWQKPTGKYTAFYTINTDT